MSVGTLARVGICQFFLVSIQRDFCGSSNKQMKFSPYVTLLSTSSGVHKFSKNLPAVTKV